MNTQTKTDELAQMLPPVVHQPTTAYNPMPVPEAALPPAKPEPKHYPPRIAKAMIAVTQQIGTILKEGQNRFQNYRYATWEGINEKLSPLLADNGLIIIQSEQSRNLIEDNDKGSTLAIVYEFTVVNEYGEQWPPITWTAISRLRDQKGMTDDKAAAKCHTQAEKYFCIKQFKIRTSDAIDNDAGDGAITHLPKKDSRELYTTMQQEIDDARSVVELETWGQGARERARVMPTDWQAHLRLRYGEKLADLKANQQTEEWSEPEEEDGVSPEWDELGPVKQAGILCKEEAFAVFLKEKHNKRGDVAAIVRSMCGVKSRTELETNQKSRVIWHQLVADYRVWQRAAEV